MKRYSLLHPLLMSFYSSGLYRDVGRNWKGTGFLYLLLPVFIALLPTLISVQWQINEAIEHEAPKFIEQVPTITISGGKASIEEEQPYFIKNPEDGSDLVIIDTTGSITSFDDTDAIVILTETELIIEGELGRPQKVNLSDFGDYVIDQEKIYSWMKFTKWFAVVAFPFGLGFWFVYRIIQALIYALVGMLFAQMLSVKLEYQTLLRLAVVAVTPAIFINMIINVLQISVPLWWLICLAVAMVYLYFAVKANAAPPEPFEARDQPMFHLPGDYRKE